MEKLKKFQKISDGSTQFRATRQYEILNFISEQVPLNKKMLISRISVFFHHSDKWCKKEIEHLINTGLLITEWKGATRILPTDYLKEYIKNLEKQIRAYQKRVEKERKQHEQWLQKLKEGIIHEEV